MTTTQITSGTTYSGFWGPSLSITQPNYALRKVIARQLSKVGALKDRQLINVLLGAAAGVTAQVARSRVQHSLINLGGSRVIESTNLVNRASTAADVTDLKANYLAYNSKPNATTYPKDLRLGH